MDKWEIVREKVPPFKYISMHNRSNYKCDWIAGSDEEDFYPDSQCYICLEAVPEYIQFQLRLLNGK